MSFRSGILKKAAYERVDEITTATQHWEGAQEKAALSSGVMDDMGTAAYELQGFINGCRLCAQMRRELGDTEVSA